MNHLQPCPYCRHRGYHLGFEWPLLGGGMFRAHLCGQWTNVDVENLKALLEKVVEAAARSALPDQPSAEDLRNAKPE